MNKQPLIDGKFDHDTCTLNNGQPAPLFLVGAHLILPPHPPGVLVYDLEAWRTASPSYTNELFEWTHKNTEDKLYTLGSQPPFNLVVSSDSAFKPSRPCLIISLPFTVLVSHVQFMEPNDSS